MRRTSGYPAGAIAFAVALTSGLAGGAAAAPPGGEQGSGRGSGAQATTVTLITGDKVSIAEDGSVAGIERAEGRENGSFSVRQIDGHRYVIPGDAAPAVAQGKLDRRLFDVTQLVADGYDDASRSDLPLIVTYAGDETPAASAFSGARARVGKELPSINGLALRADKHGGSAFWDAFTDGGDGGQGTARLSASAATKSVKKIWLDGKRRASLDRSVPQIGAPTAWNAGFDGKGVKVAVLDTGVDQAHPDLAGREIAERNFSASEDSVDRFGHGTHVASTVAGTGAKSDGRFKGVASGARILDGKVLDDGGSGEESGVIAGMEWAVAEGARVVNMSLGGPDTPGVDPLEEAVNRLSAESGALFVIAAGNEGRQGESTVGSPGSADSALTVGAVDKADELTDFSSRGPRVGDGGVKPDLTAPGAEITAAASTASDIESQYPSGTAGYATLDGTSMATPHVAGAAAILAQQHPDWSGERIKAALTGSAKPGPYSAYQQGAGRTDVARAMEQTVVVEQGPLDFGLQQWPHSDDRPVTKEITYRNLGSEPVVLDLSAEAVGVDGKPAAEGMFTVAERRLTVPAGGVASTTVTADTRVGERDGSFGGAVTAVSSDGRISVRTALGVEREVESYSLTVKHIGDDGRPATGGWTAVDGRDSDHYAELADDEDGEVTVRLPKGGYGLTGIIGGDDENGAPGSVLLAPAIRLTEDTTVVIDARRAEPTRVTVPDPAAVNTYAHLVPGFTRSDGRVIPQFLFDFPGFDSFKVGHVGPEAAADEAYAQYAGFFKSRTDGEPPVNYRLAWNRTGDLGGFTADVKRKDLAEVDLSVGKPGADTTARIGAGPKPPLNGPAIDFSTPTSLELPLRTTEYVLGNGVRWLYSVHADQSGSTLLGGFKAYEAGRRHTERFNAGVFGPALPKGEDMPQWGSPGAARSGNVMRTYLPVFGDGAGHVGVSPVTGEETSLHADGKEIAADGHDGKGAVQYTLPEQAGRYELNVDVSRDPELFPVSTRVRAQWTFRSARTSEDSWTRLPLSAVRFSPELSPTGTAKAGERFRVPFMVEGAATARAVKKLSFEVSYDDGRTWTAAKAVGGTHLTLDHPAQPGTVSLRAKLTDQDGNTLVQTIDRAYLTE
ncbi:S8 family serine peptidase [Streptomyces aurantiogriseus]|uniref:Serine protease n=1 Tax=Streptomyces aurantiogriseus TaxID=66870 RepID=A0A918CKF5_9ACTN|nr:S8 family serine peptidase [Streptomyces aurantiogriseus]GGR25601.1 serine protease [Streptomyces aurantiogriseus]